MRGKWRVLVADDDPAIRALVDAVLCSGPYEAVAYGDAEGALGAVEREERFDIVICDFMLPGMSGLDLIERLRARPAMRDVPMLVISGHDSPSMEDRAKKAGADAFLRKPFAPSQLRLAVKGLLPQNPR